MSWANDAACKGVPTEVFFDDIEKRQTFESRRHAVAKAKAICHSCPVRRACRDAALEEERGDSLHFGVRGGWTPEQRARHLKR